MKYHIKHKTKPHFLLAICGSKAAAQQWIDNFNPRIWMDKTMRATDLKIVEAK